MKSEPERKVQPVGAIHVVVVREGACGCEEFDRGPETAGSIVSEFNEESAHDIMRT